MKASSAEAPLILTLQLDAVAQAYFDALRRRHFPVERNFLNAHLTLFHALPAEHYSFIAETLRCASQRLALALKVTGVRSIGRGVAFTVECPDLLKLRSALAKEFAPWLSPQDAQGFRPHITVQNKVTPSEARALLEDLSSKMVPFVSTGEGLALWSYMGGPWKPEARFDFVDGVLDP